MANVIKPVALRAGDGVRVVSLSSPVDEARVKKGVAELERLGYRVNLNAAGVFARDGFFSGATELRAAALREALAEKETKAIVCSRGGYGVNYLLDQPEAWESAAASGAGSTASFGAKIFLGYSDLTSLQLFLWRKFGWVTLYGPMAAAGLDAGANAACGYEPSSLKNALSVTRGGWTIPLDSAESLSAGSAEGTLLGGCLTLIYTAIGTAWQLDARGAILLLEDRGMKPWQVDRALTHLRQSGSLAGVKAILLGEFPECEGPAGTETVRDVASRILTPLGIPVVWGAAVGHSARSMVTIPLGVRGRIEASGKPTLEVLEPACRER